MEFTFANQAPEDATIVAYVDGKEVYQDTLLSYAAAGGYAGQEFEHVTLAVPNREFNFQVKEESTGILEVRNIIPQSGKYVDVVFWGDLFSIQQNAERQIRID